MIFLMFTLMWGTVSDVSFFFVPLPYSAHLQEL